MSQLKSYFFSFLRIVLVILVLPAPVFAQNMTANAAPAYLGNLNTVVAKAITALISLVGIASFVMLLLGGFKFLSAGSDKEAAQKAQQTINYAISGLVICITANC
jgi:nitrogen fixation/metabolism regulation signal transduction histidine kinase